MSLFGMFESRVTLESPAVPLTSLSLLNWMAGPGTDSGIPVNEVTALNMSTVYRATALIGGLSGALPLQTFVTGTHDPADNPLLEDPHPEMTPLEFWRMCGVHRCLWGNFYAQKMRHRGSGAVEHLYPITPSRVRVGRAKPTTANPSGKVFEVTDDDGMQQPMTPREIFHVPGLGYDGLCGFSPVRIAAQAIGLGLAAERYAAKLFGSGNLMSGLMQTDQKLTQDQAETLQDRWTQRMTGLDNAHKVAVLDAGAKFESLTMPNDAAQFLQSRQFQVTELARFFGVPPYLLFETEKTTSWGCLPGDALVFTTTGPKPIESVTPGEEVWSFTGEGMTPAKVTAWHMTGHKPLLTIRTTARELRVTANHRVPVRRYFGHQAGRGLGECGWETVEISAGEIRPGDFLLVPHGLEAGDRTTAPNGRALTIEAMEFCGLYTGDGNADGNRVELAHAVDDPHMPYYRGVVYEEFGVAPYTDKGRGTRSRFSSVEARSLLECGFTGNAHTKRVPPWVFRLTPDLQLAYLRGYLDADGSISHGVISFASCNKALLEDVRHLCIGLGVPVGRVRVGRRAGTGTIRGETHYAQIKYVRGLASTPFNTRIGSNHPDKAVRLVTAPTTRRLRYDDAWEGGLGATARSMRPERTPGGTWDIPDVRLQRVVSVETGAVAVPVYDITVAEHAHYVADGVIVHNTGLEQQANGFVKFDLHPMWLAPVEQRITKELCAPGTRTRYDLHVLLRGDSVARAEFYRVMREVGAFSANDIRDMEDMPPLAEKGDVYLQPANFMPIGTDPTMSGSLGPADKGN